MREHGWAETNGIRIHYVAAGQGPLVLLLHGFPEFWYSWRRQLPALAAAGLRAVAPDLRGWGETDRPRGVAAYRVEELLKDIDGLRQALGAPRVHVVGHDWGGLLAWWYAARYPQAVDRLAVLNAPHPAAYARLLRRCPAQWLRSWYVLFFQIPWLPEALTRLVNYANVERALRCTANPGALSDADLALYMANVRRPGALTAGINYYRASARAGPRLLTGTPAVAAPTLLIWGEQDPFLVPANAAAAAPWAPRLQVERLPQAGHWVQQDAPDAVNRLLCTFLAGPAP